MRPDSGSELKKWKEKKQEKPIPIKFELTPIVNLFTSDNLDRHNISSANITKWFLPLYVRYCKVISPIKIPLPLPVQKNEKSS